MRRGLWLAIVASVGLGACSVAETMSTPTCLGGSMLIAAQSVPTAELLPCLEPLPTGWDVETVNIDDAGTRIVFDSDRAGANAARFFFEDECPPTDDAVRTPSDQDNASRFEEIREVAPRFEASRYYRFEGGCVWWDFSFDPGAPSALSVELGNSLTLMERQVVSDSLRETFVDEEL